MITFEALLSGEAKVEFPPFLVQLKGIEEPVEIKQFSSADYEILVAFDQEEDMHLHKQVYRGMTGDLSIDVDKEKTDLLEKTFSVPQLVTLLRKIYDLNGFNSASIEAAEKK